MAFVRGVVWCWLHLSSGNLATATTSAHASNDSPNSSADVLTADNPRPDDDLFNTTATQTTSSSRTAVTTTSETSTTRRNADISCILPSFEDGVDASSCDGLLPGDSCTVRCASTYGGRPTVFHCPDLAEMFTITTTTSTTSTMSTTSSKSTTSTDSTSTSSTGSTSTTSTSTTSTTSVIATVTSTTTTPPPTENTLNASNATNATDLSRTTSTTQPAQQEGSRLMQLTPAPTPASRRATAVSPTRWLQQDPPDDTQAPIIVYVEGGLHNAASVSGGASFDTESSVQVACDRDHLCLAYWQGYDNNPNKWGILTYGADTWSIGILDPYVYSVKIKQADTSQRLMMLGEPPSCELQVNTTTSTTSTGTTSTSTITTTEEPVVAGTLVEGSVVLDVSHPVDFSRNPGAQQAVVAAVAEMASVEEKWVNVIIFILAAGEGRRLAAGNIRADYFITVPAGTTLSGTTVQNALQSATVTEFDNVLNSKMTDLGVVGPSGAAYIVKVTELIEPTSEAASGERASTTTEKPEQFCFQGYCLDQEGYSLYVVAGGPAGVLVLCCFLLLLVYCCNYVHSKIPEPEPIINIEKRFSTRPSVKEPVEAAQGRSVAPRQSFHLDAADEELPRLPRQSFCLDAADEDKLAATIRTTSEIGIQVVIEKPPSPPATPVALPKDDGLRDPDEQMRQKLDERQRKVAGGVEDSPRKRRAGNTSFHEALRSLTSPTCNVRKKRGWAKVPADMVVTFPIAPNPRKERKWKRIAGTIQDDPALPQIMDNPVFDQSP